MKQLIAFAKKELLEQLRTGKVLILTIIFCLFGIMNPAIAKLTPWIMELMSDELATTGMVVSSVEVNALTSWTQFFKNMPFALIIFIVMFSGTLTTEYQKGTLIFVITKDLKRWKILVSKVVLMAVFWTVGCLISYGITYGYNIYFWDNSIVCNIGFAVFGFYLLGLWLITVILPASVFAKSASLVTIFTGAAYLITYFLSMIPKIKEFMPSYLMETADLLMGTNSTNDYFSAIVITLILIAVNIFISVVFFNKKDIA